jgi:hypothetical protein
MAGTCRKGTVKIFRLLSQSGHSILPNSSHWLAGNNEHGALAGIQKRTGKPTVTHACRNRRLICVPGAWGYNWATLPLGDINTEARFLFVSYLLASGKARRVQFLKVGDWTE